MIRFARCNCIYECVNVLPLNIRGMSMVLQVNDAVLVNDNTLVSCSSDTTLKVCLFNDACWFYYIYIFINILLFLIDVYLFFWVEIHQTWNCLSDGTCTRTLRQHSDYVTCLAAAEKNVISMSNFSWILLTAWMKGSCQWYLSKFYITLVAVIALGHIISSYQFHFLILY